MEACLGSQVQDHTGLAVDQILDHIAVVVDSSHRTVVVEDILEAGKEVGRDEMEGLAVKEVVLVEMNSIDTRVSALSIARLGEIDMVKSTIRRKATENIHMHLRIRNRSVINIRNISS